MDNFVIETANAGMEQRPGKEATLPNNGNWNRIATGRTAKQALINLIEACNDEAVSLENNWLRLKIKDDNYCYG